MPAGIAGLPKVQLKFFPFYWHSSSPPLHSSDAISKAHSNVDELKSELSDLLEKERDGGVLNKIERLRKKVLMEQFNQAVK